METKSYNPLEPVSSHNVPIGCFAGSDGYYQLTTPDSGVISVRLVEISLSVFLTGTDAQELSTDINPERNHKPAYLLSDGQVVTPLHVADLNSFMVFKTIDDFKRSNEGDRYLDSSFFFDYGMVYAAFTLDRDFAIWCYHNKISIDSRIPIDPRNTFNSYAYLLPMGHVAYMANLSEEELMLDGFWFESLSHFDYIHDQIFKLGEERRRN